MKRLAGMFRNSRRNSVKQISDASSRAKHHDISYDDHFKYCQGKGVSFVESLGVKNHNTSISKEQMCMGT